MNRSVRYLKTISSGAAKVEGILISISLWCMVAATFALVCLRGLSTKAGVDWADSILAGVSWGDELARLMVLWVSLLGASLLSREGEHIRIDLISGLASPLVLRLRRRIISAACFLVCVLMSHVSYSYIKMQLQYSDTVFLGIPSWAVQVVLPLSFAVMAIRYALACIHPQEDTGMVAK